MIKMEIGRLYIDICQNRWYFVGSVSGGGHPGRSLRMIGLDGYLRTSYCLDRWTPTNDSPAKVLRRRRSDGWTHYALIIGRKILIAAGCQRFTSTEAAIDHWKNRNRHAFLGEKDERTKQQKDYDRRLNKFSIKFVRDAIRLRDGKRIRK